MEESLQDVYKKLTALIEQTNQEDENDVKRTVNYLNALSKHIDLICKERTFEIIEEQKALLRRGTVVWVDFGFNIGEEFGGKHPAVILRTLSDKKSLTVIPLDSMSDKPEVEMFRETHDYWVKVPRITGMANITRWVNVYRVKEVSSIRVDFQRSCGAYVPIETLKNIDLHIEQYRYKGRHNKNG